MRVVGKWGSKLLCSWRLRIGFSKGNKKKGITYIVYIDAAGEDPACNEESLTHTRFIISLPYPTIIKNVI